MKKNYLTALCLGAALFAASVNAQNKVGFVNAAQTIDDIFDEDEKAAAEWFTSTYGGEYVPASAVTPEKLGEYKVLWIYVDDDYYAGLPEDLLSDEVLPAIKTWYKAGGNLLLCTFGNFYLTDLERIAYYPSIAATGTPADNPDIWYASPTYGTYPEGTLLIDNSTDPIFAGLASEPITRLDGKEYVHFPLVNAGAKQDHNCFWTMGDDPEIGDLGAGNASFLTTWEDKWGAQALATWDHVQDYFGAAIARWSPKGDFTGKAITIGIAAYQWSQAGNPYLSNVKRLTQNALDELCSNSSKTAGLQADGINASIDNDNMMNIAGDGILSACIYNLGGKQIGTYNATQIAAGISIAHLQQGIYIVSVQTANGTTFNTKIARQ